MIRRSTSRRNAIVRAHKAIQQSFDFERGAVAPLVIGGRHDACIARRAQVVVEAMVALALAELKLRA